MGDDQNLIPSPIFNRYYTYLVVKQYTKLLVDTRVLGRRQKKRKKSLNIVLFDSKESRVNRSQDLEKKKKEHSRI